MSHTDQDITIPALTVEQIASLEENQLSLDLNLPSGSMDFTYDPGAYPGLRVGEAASPYALDTLDLNGNFDWSNLSISNGGTGTSPSLVWTDTTNPMTVNQSGRISLQGDDADIEINGESVVSLLREIRDRLNIIQVSETMEKEWDELRALREQYEAKLAECREKSRAWEALKQMPPPQVP
jgi:hypothetical protein